jgi:DNA invertase Pin-like site-specific DNA recombinase
MIPRQAIYARQSVLNETDDRSYSVNCETQIADCRKVAEQRGGAIVEVYEDRGVTAADPRVVRPGFEAMLAAVEAGEVDEVITAVQSRLARHPAVWSVFTETCSRAGVTVVIDGREARLEDPDEDLRTGLTVLLDRREVAMVKKRVTRKMAELAEGGFKPAGAPGYGYELIVREDKRKTLGIVEAEAEIIRQIAGRVLSGEAVYALARELNERGVPTRSGGPWRQSTITRILTSERIAGLRVHQGKTVGKAAWPGIIDEVTHARLVRLFADPRRKAYVRRGGRAMLTGIAECSKCGQFLNSAPWSKPGRPEWDQVKYYCRHCRGTSVSAVRLEEYVRDLLVDAVDTAALAAADTGDDTGALLADLDQLDGELAALAADYGSGAVTRDEWQAARAGLTRRRAAVSARLDQQAAARASSVWAGRGGQLRAAWDGLTVEDRREAVSAVFARIVVGPAVRGVNRFDPHRVEVTFRV